MPILPAAILFFKFKYNWFIKNSKTSILFLPNTSFVAFILISLACLSFACTTKRKEKEDISWITSVTDKAVEYADKNQRQYSLRFVDSMIAGRNLNVREQFRVYSYKAGTYFWENDHQKESLYIDSMLQLIEKSGPKKYPEEYSTAQFARGDYLLMIKDYSNSFNFYYKGRLVNESNADSCKLSEFSYRIGMVLFKQKNFLQSANEFKRAIKENSKCEPNFVNYYRRQELLDNIALCYLNEKNIDSSLTYANKALSLIQAHKGKFPLKERFSDVAEGVVFGTIGKIHLLKGNYTEAIDYLKRGIAINGKIENDITDAQVSQLKLAEAYEQVNELDSMSATLKSLRTSLENVKNEKAEVEWNKLIARYYERTGSFVNANKYLNRYLILNDSLFREESKLSSNNINKQLELLENKNELISLHNENNVQNLLLILLGLLVVFAITIVSLSFYIIKSNRKNIKELTISNKTIEQQKGELEEKNREKDRILRIVAHDLRSPVASIALLADMILEEQDEVEQKKMVKLIQTSTNSSLTIISEILESIGTGSPKPLAASSYSINDFLNHNVQLLRLKTAEKNQSIKIVPLAEDQLVKMNKEKIERVLTNLVANAMKFSGEGTEIVVTAENKEDAIEIAVKDNGIGIPDNLKDKVFDIFTEAKRVGTAGERPFGLGLSICKKIVEDHGGRIWLRTEWGRGAAFYFTLPK